MSTKHIVITQTGGVLYGTITNHVVAARYIEISNVVDMSNHIKRLSRNVTEVSFMALRGPHPDEELPARLPQIGVYEVRVILECAPEAQKVFDREQ